jgi:hypothetical protein
MTARTLSALLGLTLIAGCSEKPAPASPPPPPQAEPTDYLNTVVRAQKHATKTIDAAAVNKALQEFYITEGRFPKTLKELEEKSYLPAVPVLPAGMTWDYDTNTGVAKVRKS